MDIPHRKPPHQAKIQSFGPNPTPARGMYYIGVDHNNGNTIYYNGIFNGICSMYLTVFQWFSMADNHDEMVTMVF